MNISQIYKRCVILSDLDLDKESGVMKFLEILSHFSALLLRC